MWKNLFGRGGGFFFSLFIFYPQEVESRDEIQWILQRRNLIAAEWIFV